jgi:molybdopterin biosynthesis enzyme MoaB
LTVYYDYNSIFSGLGKINNGRDIMTSEDKILQSAEHAVYESITKALVNDYRGPIKDAVDAVCTKHQSRLIELTEKAYLSVLEADGFGEAIQQAMKDKVARALVSKFGGEIEARVNELKSDPSTRARITLAIAEIIRDK